ncbi:MAG: ferritin family protein [Desulfobacterales bacterium]
MFSLKDIIDIAVQIEQNGERVYRNAAKKIKDPSLKSLMQWLADEETRHERWFQALKGAMPETGEYPEQEEMGRALLRDAVGSKSFALENADFSSMEKIEELLRLAIEFEQDTMLFYKMLQPLIEGQRTLEQLHVIIQEEENHAARLKEMLPEAQVEDGKG